MILISITILFYERILRFVVFLVENQIDPTIIYRTVGLF